MQINVDAAIKQKSPRWHRWLPKWLIRWVERTIHQAEMNDFLAKHSGDSSIQFAQETVNYFDVTVRVNNEENLPKSGRYILVSNHPLGGLDGLAIIGEVGKHRTDIKFPVNDLLMQLEPMHEVFVPINKHGRNSHDTAKMFDEIFTSDALVCYFPAGLCSRKQKGKICDLEWKKTIISKAKQYQRDIIPLYFGGKNSNRFYRLANFRKRIGIKFNIEMLYLPDEMFRQRGNTLEMTFGAAIPYTTFDRSKSDKEWAAWLKSKVYELQKI